MHATMVDRGEQDAASQCHTSGILLALASLLEADAGSTVHAFKFPGSYATLPVTSRISTGLITHVMTLTDITAAGLLGYLAAITLRAAAAERDFNLRFNMK